MTAPAASPAPQTAPTTPASAVPSALAASAATPALSVQSLRVAYGERVVLDDVDLTVPTGSLVAVLGPSGCGKTTLLRSIAGFLHPHAGRIEVAGNPVFDAAAGLFTAPEKRRIGYVPQEGALFPHLDVAGNIAFGLPSRERRTGRVAELLELVGLADYAHAHPHELSGGQQQRVALARALAPSPSMVLLDEPFAALDALSRMEVRDDVRRVLRAAGATAILVTHDRDEALGWADLVAIVDAGRIVQTGTPVEVYLRPAGLAVARSVGETVEIPAHLEQRNGRAVAVCALGDVPATVVGQHRNDSTLLLRPGQVRLSRLGEPGAAGTVVERYFTGEHTEITVLLPDGVRVHAHLADAPGDLVVGAQARVTSSGPGILLPA